MHASFFGMFISSFRIGSWLVACALLLPLSIKAAAPKEDAAIRGVLDAQVAAWNRGDIDGFMQGYDRSPATEFVSGDKLERGWQTVHDRYKAKYNNREKMGQLSFAELLVRFFGRDDAYVIGKWKLVRTADTPHGRFTLIFHRSPNGWRIVHDHTS